jgi:hypothetical protein
MGVEDLDGPIRSRFSLVFLDPRLNAEFPNRLHVARLFLTKHSKYEHKMPPPPPLSLQKNPAANWPSNLKYQNLARTQ